MKHLPIIGVVGSHIDAHEELSTPLGQLIAQSNYHLLTGGGEGVMSAVAKSFTKQAERKGICIGILPISEHSELKELPHYTNPYIELPIVTKLDIRAAQGSTTPLALNSVNILSSNVIIALPGLKGTEAETSMALVCNKPVILFGPMKEFEHFPTEPMRAETIDEVKSFIHDSLHKKADESAEENAPH